MRRIVAKNKFSKNNRIYAYYGADGKMAILDTATLQQIASPMYVETAPIQASAETAPVLVAETATLQPQISTLQPAPVLVAETLPSPTQTLQPAPVLVAEALPTQPIQPTVTLPTMSYSEPVTMATQSNVPSTNVTPSQTTTTVPQQTVMPMSMPMGGGGGMPSSKPASTTTTTTTKTSDGVVQQKTTTTTFEKEGMSTGMKVGLGILALVAGYMVYKNRKQIFG